MTPQEFAEKMKALHDHVDCLHPDPDEEVIHERADLVMCDVLRELGYGAGVEWFLKMSRWYA